MAAPKHVWRGICEYPLTDEYERGHEATFGKRADGYCPKCELLKAWCECEDQGSGPIARIEGGK